MTLDVPDWAGEIATALPGELKPALYTLRVLLTGIHLMRTGEVVADIPACRAAYTAYGILGSWELGGSGARRLACTHA